MLYYYSTRAVPQRSSQNQYLSFFDFTHKKILVSLSRFRCATTTIAPTRTTSATWYAAPTSPPSTTTPGGRPLRRGGASTRRCRPPARTSSPRRRGRSSWCWGRRGEQKCSARQSRATKIWHLAIFFSILVLKYHPFAGPSWPGAIWPQTPTLCGRSGKTPPTTSPTPRRSGSPSTTGTGRRWRRKSGTTQSECAGVEIPLKIRKAGHFCC